MIAIILLILLYTLKREAFGMSISNIKIRYMKYINASCIATIILCIGICILYNYNTVNYLGVGQYQYNMCAEAFLDGRLNLDDGIKIKVPEQLKNMKDPWEYKDRRQEGLIEYDSYLWDAVYYSDHYYMYFGVIPVITTYIPLKLVGIECSSISAICIALIIYILGIFTTFLFLAKKFFEHMSILAYMLFSISCSLISSYALICRPSLYAIPFIYGLAFLIWCTYFYLRCIFEDDKSNIHNIYLIAGSLCGALVFGCRPTMALTILTYIPLFIEYIKRKGINIKRTIIIIAPYIVVGILLMIYNYNRFGNVLEFGARYNLTNPKFGAPEYTFQLKKTIYVVIRMFFGLSPLEIDNNFEAPAGLLIRFPVLFVGTMMFFMVLKKLKEIGIIWWLASFIPVSLSIITLVFKNTNFTMWDRYRLDYILMVLLISFISVGIYVENWCGRLALVINIFVIISIISSLMLAFIPYDGNFAYFNHELAKIIRTVILVE